MNALKNIVTLAAGIPLLVLSSINALHAATTDPVGYVTLTVKGDSDTRFSIPMVSPSVFSGMIQSVDAQTGAIVIDGASWAENELVFGDPDNVSVNNTYFCVVTSGTQNGAVFKITANDATSLTVDSGLNDLSQLSSIAADTVGDSITIHPYWTLGSVFAGATVPDGTQVFKFDNSDSSVNKSPSTVYTYFASFDAWSDGVSASAVDHTALMEIGTGYVLRTPASSSDFNLTMAGAVPLFNDRLVISNDASSSVDITFSLSAPAQVAIGDTNLGVQDGVSIFVYDNSSVGKNKSASTVLTYYESFNAWSDGVSPTAVDDTFFLQPGVSYVLRKPTTAQAEIVETSFAPAYLSTLNN